MVPKDIRIYWYYEIHKPPVKVIPFDKSLTILQIKEMCASLLDDGETKGRRIEFVKFYRDRIDLFKKSTPFWCDRVTIKKYIEYYGRNDFCYLCYVIV